MQNKNILTGFFARTSRTQNDSLSCHCERSVAIAELSRNQEPPSRHPALDAGSVNNSENRFRLGGRNDGMTCHCERPAGALQSHYRQVKAAFTLAEVLITLGVIGVVAAVTLPTVVNNMQARIRAEQVRSAKYKFTLATDKMNSLGLIGPYESTEAFIKELGKHLKIAKVCSSNKLEGCWPTKEVKLDDDGNMYEIKKAITGKQFKMESNDKSDYTSNNVGIVTADGVPMIISYNKNCEPLDSVKQYPWTTEDNKPVSNATAGCVAAVMDINGSKKPNKLGEDVVLFNAKGLGGGCGMEIGGKCYSALISNYPPLSNAECEARKNELGIKDCMAAYYGDDDYWGGAVAACGHLSKMVTPEDMAALATILYGTNVGGYDRPSGLTYNTHEAANLGLPGPGFAVWLGDYHSETGAYYRAFDENYTQLDGGSRTTSSFSAICLVD